MPEHTVVATPAPVGDSQAAHLWAELCRLRAALVAHHGRLEQLAAAWIGRAAHEPYGPAQWTASEASATFAGLAVEMERLLLGLPG